MGTVLVIAEEVVKELIMSEDRGEQGQTDSVEARRSTELTSRLLKK